MSFKPRDASIPTIIPTRGTEFSAGVDIYTCEAVNLLPGACSRVSTNIQLSFEGLSVQPGRLLYAEICNKSSNPSRGYQVVTGIIDRDYEGELFVQLQNLTSQVLRIETFSAIAQVIIKECVLPVAPLKTTCRRERRGSGGFGSTDAYMGHAGNALPDTLEMFELDFE